MTVTNAPVPAPAPADDERRRAIVTRLSTGDRVFRGILRMAGLAVLVITAGILAFLVLRAIPTFTAEGFGFFTTQSWFISTNQYGIAAILPFGILVALIALFIAVPVGIAAGLFISELQRRRGLRRSLIAITDPHGGDPQHHRRPVRVLLRDAPDPRSSRAGSRTTWRSSRCSSSRLANSSGNYARPPPSSAGYWWRCWSCPSSPLFRGRCSRRPRKASVRAPTRSARPAGGWSARSCCRTGARG